MTDAPRTPPDTPSPNATTPHPTGAPPLPTEAPPLPASEQGPPIPSAESANDHPHSVLCERHGLRYNPHTHAGCVRCRGVAAAANPEVKSPTTGPPLVFWILLGSAVVAGVVLLFSGGDPTEAAPGTAATAATGASAPAPSTEAPGSPDETAAATAAATAASVAEATNWPTHDGVGEVFINDQAEPEPFMVGDKAAPDLRSVRYRGYNGHLTVTFEFTRGLDDHARDMALGIAPAVAFLDTDLDSTTGEKGFAGREGFERAVVGYVGVRYDSDSEDFSWTGGIPDTPIVDSACSHDVGTVSGYFLDLSYDPEDDDALANTTCSGATLTARVPYDRLGVVAGQKVRIATEENMGSGSSVRQYFLDDALITLQ